MRLLKNFFILSVLLTLNTFLFSQELNNPEAQFSSEQQEDSSLGSANEEKKYATLPRGYRGVTLGMNLDTTKSTLKKHPEFGYHGDRDVSLLPGENRVLIETDAESGHGSNFLKECYFQFYEDNLYLITINVNKEKMDYYSMFTTLTEKYGPPTSLNPNTSKWENDTTIVYLEKPLTLKYIDKKTFEETNTSQIDLSPVELTREMFLEGL